MFDLEAQIKWWREELARTGIAREVVEELEGHLREQFARLIATGCPESEAFQTAVWELGDGKTLKTEFSKLKRDRLRIFWSNPLGINVLAVWIIIEGVNGVVMTLRRLCLAFLDFAREVLQNYSFKGVEARGLAAIDWNMTVTASLLILIGIGLLRRWRICRVAAFVFALPQIFFEIYYFVLGHAMPGAPTIPLPPNVVVHTMFLGLPLPYGFIYVRRYVGLVILVWGVCALLREFAGKYFRRAVAE